MRFDAERARAEIERIRRQAEAGPVPVEELRRTLDGSGADYRNFAFCNHIPVDLRLGYVVEKHPGGRTVKHLMATHASNMAVDRLVMLQLCQAFGFRGQRIFDTRTMTNAVVTHALEAAADAAERHSSLISLNLRQAAVG